MDVKKKQFIDALITAKGIIMRACAATKQNRSTVYNWIGEDNEFKEAVNDVQEVALDFVEGKLFDLIDKEETAAIIFYMKTKGKKRGYIERQEIAAEVMGNVTLRFDKDDEQLGGE